MTSTISLSKVNAVLKKNFRLNKASFIVTNLLAAAGAVGICAAAIGFADKNSAYHSYVYNVTDEFVSSTTLLLLFFGVIQLFFLSVKMFREIYSRQASDSFYAMPVTRKEYYTANVLYGLINIAVLFAVVAAVSLVFGKAPVLFDVVHNILDLKPFIKALAVNFSVLLYVFFGFILAVVLCGRRWQTFAISVTGFASVYILISTAAGYMNSVYGYYIENIDGGFKTLLTMLNGGNTVNMAAVAACNIVLAAVIFVVGYFVFKNRKAEAAEQNLSGKIVPFVLQGFICAASYGVFSIYGNKLWLKILIGIAVCCVTAVIFCAVFYKKALTKAAVITAAVVCAVMSAFIIGVDKFPQNHYIGYVPEAEDIQSVEFVESGDNYAYVYSESSLTYLDYLFYNDSYSGDNDSVKIESQEGIESLLKIHAKAVSDEVMKSYNKHYSDPYSDDVDHDWYSFKLVYKLKNGKTVTRCYAVDTKDFIEEYAAFIQTDEVIEQKFPFNLNKDSILFARIEDVNIETFEAVDYEASDYYKEEAISDDDFGIYYSEDSYFTLDNYGEFFDLYKQDVKERDSKTAIMLGSDNSFYFTYYDENMPSHYSVSVYYLSDDAPPELAEKIRKMTPSQVEKYMYDSTDNYVVEEWLSFDRTIDKNVASFLEARGILK